MNRKVVGAKWIGNTSPIFRHGTVRRTNFNVEGRPHAVWRSLKSPGSIKMED